MGLNDLIGEKVKKENPTPEVKEAEKKSYKSYYFFPSTNKLIKKVTDNIALDRKGYSQDDAAKEAFQLLAEKHNIDI